MHTVTTIGLGLAWFSIPSTASPCEMRPLTGVTNRATGHRPVKLQASGLCAGAAQGC
jgi:hypothetical protein